MTGRCGDGRRRDSGVTLVELLLASSLLMVLMAVTLSTVLGVRDGAARARTQHDLNEEGRNALNRMVREIRQAAEVTYVVNPDGPAFDPDALVALSLKADFNGDGCAGNTVPAPCATDVTNNPEEITYCFDPQAAGQQSAYLWLIPEGLVAAPTSCALSGARPILAGNVAGFFAEYRSNEYRFDTEPPSGVTTWRELDAAIPPVGDVGGSDGDINTSAVRGVNSVVLHLQMEKDGLEQSYTTQVDVRNNP